MNSKIDLVIPWVDGNDPEWQVLKNTYMESENLREIGDPGIRYQSWDNLQYIFRGIEKYLLHGDTCQPGLIQTVRIW